jgi:predicted transcriptional regulator with HTH domain
MTVNANGWEFLSLREDYQLMHGRAYDNYLVEIQEAIKSDPKTSFGLLKGCMKGKNFQPITSIAPKLTTTTDDTFKILSFHELGSTLKT